MDVAPDRMHATAIALGDAAALIRGPSGSGKSDLALRCLSLPAHPLWGPRPRLVADDQILLHRAGNALSVSGPAAIRGKLEVRGLGILELDAIEGVFVRLVVDLAEASDIERLPDPESRISLLGVDVPHLRIAPFEQSAPIKLLLALARSAKALD